MGDTPKLVWHRGKLAVSFTEGGKRYRRSLGTDDIATARTRMADYFRARQQDTGKSLTVAGIYAGYIKDRTGEGKSVTRIQDAWKRLEPTFGNMPPDLITKDMCRDYGALRRKQGISDGTIHLELGYLRAALMWAEGEYQGFKAPVVPLPSKPPPRDRWLTRDEAAKVRDAAIMPHVRLAIVLLLTTAARVSAILELTWNQVDFMGRRINLNPPGRRQTAKGRATPPINDMALTALLEAKKAALSAHVIEWAGEPVKSIKKGVGEAGRRAGVKVTPHVFRHTAAVWMAQDGVPLVEIAQYLGHSNPATTYRVYARFSPDHLRKAARSLEF